jgi:hypothetical protein
MRDSVSRRSRVTVIVLAALAFIGVSVLLARMLSVGNAERDAVVAVVRAQARGDEATVLARVRGCRGDDRCRARLRSVLAAARRPGVVKVLRFDGPSGLSLDGRRGTARIAWKAGRALPVVQCVKLRTDGNPVTGYSVRVIALGAPIGREAGC